MKTTTNFFKLAFFVIMLLSLSCSPEDGRDGEQGPQGIAGQDGQDGTNGSDGADGNANVIVSQWIDSGFATNASTQSTFSQVDSRINLDVVNTAAFLVYGKRNLISSTVIVTQIPVVDDERSYFYDLFPGTNTIFFRAESVDKTTQLVFDDFSEFRYVIIPPSTSKGEKNYPNFSKMTYEEVMDYFELGY